MLILKRASFRRIGSTIVFFSNISSFLKYCLLFPCFEPTSFLFQSQSFNSQSRSSLHSLSVQMIILSSLRFLSHIRTRSEREGSIQSNLTLHFKVTSLPFPSFLSFHWKVCGCAANSYVWSTSILFSVQNAHHKTLEIHVHLLLFLFGCIVYDPIRRRVSNIVPSSPLNPPLSH